MPWGRMPQHININAGKGYYKGDLENENYGQAQENLRRVGAVPPVFRWLLLKVIYSI
jgi:hypothetical protein